MRKLFLVLFCLMFISEIADAQMRRNRVRRSYMSRTQRIGELSYLGSAGISIYFGDLKQSINLWAKPSAGGGVQYRLSKNFSLRGELLWYRISGVDTLNDVDYTIHPRNLSFRADNLEGTVTLVGYYFNKYNRPNRPVVNPYGFIGLGFTSNTPKAKYQDEWHSLRPLQTEGVDYSSVLFTVPFGVGVTYHDIFPQFDIALEVGYRYTFSDYMDDVSTNYRDKNTFTDPVAKELSDRRDEFLRERGIAKEDAASVDYAGPYTFYFGNNYRGNPSNNDWYLISNVKLTYSPGAPTKKIYRRNRRSKF